MIERVQAMVFVILIIQIVGGISIAVHEMGHVIALLLMGKRVKKIHVGSGPGVQFKIANTIIELGIFIASGEVTTEANPYKEGLKEWVADVAGAVAALLVYTGVILITLTSEDALKMLSLLFVELPKTLAAIWWLPREWMHSGIPLLNEFLEVATKLRPAVAVTMGVIVEGVAGQYNALIPWTKRNDGYNALRNLFRLRNANLEVFTKVTRFMSNLKVALFLLLAFRVLTNLDLILILGMKYYDCMIQIVTQS